MNERELYQQKMKAQLDEWKADADKLRAKAAGASAEVRLKIEHQLRDLDARIDEGRAKLATLAAASGEAWESLKVGIEAAWATLKSSVRDAASKFKD